MSLRSFAIKPIALAALLGLTGAANASFITYDSTAAFNAALTGLTVGTDNFSSLDTALTSTVARNAGAISYVATGLDDVLYNAGGALSTLNSDDHISFGNFSSPVYAIGANFFNTDEGSNFVSGGAFTLTIVDAAGSHDILFANTTSQDAFFGIKSTLAITSLTVSTTVADQFPTVDNLTLAAAVPEPETYALMLAGLGIVGFMAARQRKAG